MFNLFSLNLKWIVRDRVLQAMFAASIALIALVPVLSAFPMRQPQELSITLSLSFISFVLLVFTLVLGSTMVWRDIERRYTYSVLSLPFNRGSYIMAKFLAIVFFIAISSMFIGFCSFIAIKITVIQNPFPLPVQWERIILSIFMDILKYTLLAAISVLVSSLATSFFMPFFTSIVIFLTGSASQEVYEFITSPAGENISEFTRSTATAVYYIIPNFGVFDFKLQAIYPIPVDYTNILYACAYFIIYTTLAISLAMISFSKRELM